MTCSVLIFEANIRHANESTLGLSALSLDDRIFPCKKNFCTRITSAAPAEGYQAEELHQVESETQPMPDTRAATWQGA